MTRDSLAGKRLRLAELMNARLGREYFSADMPELRSMPESQLDMLLVYYGGNGSACVW